MSKKEGLKLIANIDECKDERMRGLEENIEIIKKN